MKNQQNNTEEKRKSLIITLLLGLALGALLFFFQLSHEEPQKLQAEIVLEFVPDPVPPPVEQEVVPKPTEDNSSSSKDAGSNRDTSARGKVNSSKNTPKDVRSKDVEKSTTPISGAPNTANQDLDKEEQKRQNNALDNLLNNKNNQNTQGGAGNSRTGSGSGNLEGSGDTGDGEIGKGGRKLIKKIPGTEGAGGSIPSHTCGPGTTRFKYWVDKGGNITSVQRTSGSSDPCHVNAGKQWIQSYVKANAGSSTAFGTYKISF